MKNPLYNIDHVNLVAALRSDEFSVQFAMGNVEEAIQLILAHSMYVGHQSRIDMKVKRRKINTRSKSVETLVGAAGTTIQELKHLYEEFKTFLYINFSIPKSTHQPLDFSDVHYEYNKQRIASLINFNNKVNHTYLPLKDEITKAKFIEFLFKFAQPFVMGVDRKLSPDIFTEETMRQCYALIILYVEQQSDPYRNQTAYLIQKFVGYTKYAQDRVNKYLTNPTYYLKFRAGIQILIDNITDIYTKTPFKDMTQSKQYAYIELWIKYNLDVYSSINNSKKFSVLDEPAQIGFVAGRNPNSRENALARFDEGLKKLSNNKKPKTPKSTRVELTKKLNNW